MPEERTTAPVRVTVLDTVQRVAGPIDRTLEKFGRENPVHDFMKIDRTLS
jgi:hypothetical protein